MADDLPTLQSAKPAHGWAPMFFIGLGIALVIMDATIVNVSLPTIIEDLNLSSIDAEWVNAVYSLTFAALLIVFGRIGDRVGRKKIFMIGAAVFGLASIWAAASQSAPHLISARALQGVGGAMMSPTSLSLVNSLYVGKARNIAFAIYGSVIGGMAAMGPLVGGFLTTNYSWTWAFWINVPLALVIILGSWRIVPESKDPTDKAGLDILGAILSAVGIALLIFGLIEGRNYGWVMSTTDSHILKLHLPEGKLSPVFIAFVVAAVSLVALYFWENARVRADKSALLDFSLFKIPTFGLGSFAAMILSLGEFGILFSLPLFMQSVLGYSAMGSGALLATLALGSFVAAPTAANLANKRGARFVARMGMALEVVAIFGLGVVMSTTTTGWMLAFWLFLYGLGVGYASAQLTGLILVDVPVKQSGQASGTQSTARQVGSAMGTAILGTVLFITLYNQTYSHVSDLGAPPQVAESVATAVEKSAGTAIIGLDQPPNGSPELQQAAGTAFADAFSITAYVAAAFVALGLLATLALPPDVAGRKPEEFAEGLAPGA